MDLNCTLCREQENKSNYSQPQKESVMHREHIPNEMCRDMLKENSPRLGYCLLSVTRRKKMSKQEAATLSQFAHITVLCIIYTHQAKARQKKKKNRISHSEITLSGVVHVILQRTLQGDTGQLNGMGTTCSAFKRQSS